MYCCTYWYILILPTSCVEDSFIYWMFGSLGGFLHLTKQCFLIIKFYRSIIFSSCLQQGHFLSTRDVYHFLQHKCILLTTKWSSGSKKDSSVWNHAEENPGLAWSKRVRKNAKPRLAPEARSQHGKLEGPQVVRICVNCYVSVCVAFWRGHSESGSKVTAGVWSLCPWAQRGCKVLVSWPQMPDSLDQRQVS